MATGQHRLTVNEASIMAQLIQLTFLFFQIPKSKTFMAFFTNTNSNRRAL